MPILSTTPESIAETWLGAFAWAVGNQKCRGIMPAFIDTQLSDGDIANLAAYFATLIPGDTVYRNRIAALIQDQAGVVDFTLTEPAANVAMLVDTSAVQLASLGTVALS